MEGDGERGGEPASGRRPPSGTGRQRRRSATARSSRRSAFRGGPRSWPPPATPVGRWAPRRGWRRTIQTLGSRGPRTVEQDWPEGSSIPGHFSQTYTSFFSGFLVLKSTPPAPSHIRTSPTTGMGIPTHQPATAHPPLAPSAHTQRNPNRPKTQFSRNPGGTHLRGCDPAVKPIHPFPKPPGRV